MNLNLVKTAKSIISKGKSPKDSAIQKRLKTLPGTTVPYRNDAQRLNQYPQPQ